MLRNDLFNFVNVCIYGKYGVFKYCQFPLIDRIEKGICYTPKKKKKKNAFGARALEDFDCF